MRRSAALSFVFTLLVSVTLLVTATPAGACSCSIGDDATAYDRADAVFLGEVDRIHEARSGLSTNPEVVILQVSDVFKGEVDRLQGVATATSGASCGFEFISGGSYVVYGSGSSGGQFQLEDGFYEVNLCSGTRPLAQGAPEFATASVAPNDAGPPATIDIRAQLGDPRSSILPEAIIFASVLAFVLGLAAWFSRKNRPAI